MMLLLAQLAYLALACVGSHICAALAVSQARFLCYARPCLENTIQKLVSCSEVFDMLLYMFVQAINLQFLHIVNNLRDQLQTHSFSSFPTKSRLWDFNHMDHMMMKSLTMVEYMGFHLKRQSINCSWQWKTQYLVRVACMSFFRSIWLNLLYGSSLRFRANLYMWGNLRRYSQIF